MEAWQTILLSITGAIGGTGVMIAILGWLTKSFIASRIQRDLEAHKAELQLQNQLALEQVKSEAARLGQEHQIQFSKLHEKRGEVISEIHGILVDMQYISRELKTGKAKDDASLWRDQVTELAKINLKFSEYVTRNSLYFSFKLVERLNKLAELVFFVAVAPEEGTGSTARDQEEKEKAIERHLKMKSSLSEVTSMVEMEFRELLGVRSVDEANFQAGD